MRNRKKKIIHADGTVHTLFTRSFSGKSATASVKARQERLATLLGPRVKVEKENLPKQKRRGKRVSKLYTQQRLFK